MVSIEDTAESGITLAKKAIHAVADGCDDEALAILNTGDHGEITWAAAFLMSALRESVGARFKRPGQVRWALHAAANDLEDDLMTQVGLILQQAERDGP